jgi:hypothetical protein
VDVVVPAAWLAVGVAALAEGAAELMAGPTARHTSATRTTRREVRVVRWRADIKRK